MLTATLISLSKPVDPNLLMSIFCISALKKVTIRHYISKGERTKWTANIIINVISLAAISN